MTNKNNYCFQKGFPNTDIGWSNR